MKKIYFLSIFTLFTQGIVAQDNIWDFSSIEPNPQTNQLVFPPTHTFQYLVEENSPDVNGNNVVSNLDFTAYVPIEGSSTNGYVGINGETTPGGMTVLDVNYDATTKLWNVPIVTNIDFSAVGGTARNCSGGVTPWGTILTAEEIVNTSPHTNGNNQLGWLVEVNPSTKTVLGKRYQMGNFRHENAAVHMGTMANNRVVYTGSDQSNGFVCKFVADNPEDLSSGLLYVLDVPSGATTGNWILVPNLTITEQNASSANIAASLQNFFSGVEDVEVGADGWIYFTAKGDRATYRFREKDDDPFGTEVEAFEVYVGSESAFNGGGVTTVSYEIAYDGGTKMLAWGANDNLAIDNDNNLWVLMDGASANEILVVENGHTQANPKIKLFAISPNGSEPTGLTFSPDNRFMFLSMQHPSVNNVAQQQDATDAIRDFNKDVTIVMARTEDLGTPPLALELLKLDGVIQNKQVELEWFTQNEYQHASFSIQRQSAEDTQWTDLGTVAAKGNSSSKNSYSFIDTSPVKGMNYYRLKQTSSTGKVSFSHIIWVKYNPILKSFEFIKNPVRKQLKVRFEETFDLTMGLFIINAHGQRLKQHNLSKGQTYAEIDVTAFAPGIYYFGTGEGRVEKFVIVP